MKVYCPCGDQCSGYSGSARRCSCVEKSETIPPHFVGHLAKLTINSAKEGDWLATVLGAAITGGTVWLSGQDETSYQVWQCPACDCEVLYQVTEQENGERTEKLGAITTCEE
jgi:hypothetical protein